MTNRTVLAAVLAAVLAVPAAAGLAGTHCDLLPTTNKKEISPEKIEGTLCNACVGLPVPGARDRNGNGLDYNDGAKHWECEIMVGNRGSGQCKRQTICLPGGERFFDNGVMRCRYPAVVITVPGLPPNPREDCERKLKVSISRVKGIDGLPLTNNVVVKPGPVGLLLEGDGAANGVYATIGGGISASVGAAASRLGSTLRSLCLPPNCQVVDLGNLGNAPTGNQTLTLYTPHGFASASVGLLIAAPTPTPSYSVVQQHPVIGSGGGPAVLVGSGPTPTRTPTPRPVSSQSYSASLSCPGTETPYGRTFQTNNPTPVFEIRSARVQATASAQWLNTRSSQGSQICTWEDAYQFKIKALDGQGDVTVSWTPQHSGNYYNPLTLSMTQTISLTQGRWQIVPDASFPPDFLYSIGFRD